MEEFVTCTGKVQTRENGKTVKVLENTLNELAKNGYEFVSIEQYIFDGLNFSLIMKREVS